MAEMVLVLDESHRIALTNRAFCNSFDSSVEQMQGKHVDGLPWVLPSETQFSSLIERLVDGKGDAPVVSLKIGGGKTRTLKPNVSEIEDESGVRRGYLVSLDDITALEEKQTALQAAMEKLQASQLEIEQRNEQLKLMATRDPMTGCLNRRAFFEKIEELWKSTLRYRHHLSCLMIDVDHFKAINDNHGHAVGDEVLKRVSQALMNEARETDYVCRYGGEEFCIILPHVDVEGAATAGERFRQVIASLEFDQLHVTASLGCSSFSLGPDSVESMIDQADQALYAAKHNGRNRVVRFDEAFSDTDVKDVAKPLEFTL
jgi:diguanylate cyclase (GGDEF)-like protein/PAS domain S-box-containing protein